MTDRRATTCRKLRYRDEIAANLALATLQRQGKTGHHETRTYRCEKCRGWHLTSKRRGKR